MAKATYNIAIDKLSGALDSKQYGLTHGYRLVSRHVKKDDDEHQVYFMKMHEGEWSAGATKNRELIKAAQKKAHAIDKAARKPEACSPELVEDANRWKDEFAAYRAGLKEGEKGYGTLYTYTYVKIYRQMKDEAGKE